MSHITLEPQRNSDPKILRAARNLSDLMALWALCEQRTCRKLGRCRAVPLTCLKSCVELVPVHAAEFVILLFEGKEDDLTFDQALESIPEDIRREWFAWHHAVMRMTGRPSVQLPASAPPNSGART